jgi:hypoxanthine phosphoribosyltransferase
MQDQIERVLIDRERIAKRVAELAAAIYRDHAAGGESAGQGVPEAEITIVTVLTGAIIFCCDLIRQIPIAMKIGLLTVSSYPGGSVQSKGARLSAQQLGNIQGRRVVLVEDILDSGGTIRLIVPMLRQAGAASVKTCCLLRKDRPATRDIRLDYVGFEIPDEFVVGYGLDLNDYYRNLPDIVTLRPEVIARLTTKPAVAASSAPREQVSQDLALDVARRSG